LGNCLNMLEPFSINFAKNAYDRLLSVFAKANQMLPINKGANRELDCTVINYLHKLNADNNLRCYDTVRSAFWEGTPLYESSFFTDRLHIEICVLNPEMIKGYFLPRPIEIYNPYLNKDFNKKDYLEELRAINR
jgi:hypothetical protein